MSPTLCWAIAVVLFAITEGLSVGLTSIWFAVGALVSMVASFFIESIWAQVWIFLLVSLVTLIALRPIAAKFFTAKGHVPTNSDRIIGKEAVVKEAICNLENRGLVQVMGQK
ncbi:MAG: NfeD family protein [Oscillospiraceae bacterium]|nr:NfeD family protein [Oscillospiraceae bacterium]